MAETVGAASINVVILAPVIILKADASKLIQISQGQIIIERVETYINPRVSAPDS